MTDSQNKCIHQFFEEQVAQTPATTGALLFRRILFWGNVSAWVTQQLKTKGEEVALVALIQCPGPDYPKYRPNITFALRWIYSVAKKMSAESNNLSVLEPNVQALTQKLTACITEM